MKKLIVLILTATALRSYAQYPRVDIPGSEVRKITSSIVSGQEYELQVLLPGSHKSSTKKYPVVYLMDSQWDFPLVKSIYGQQYYDGFIPELIIVGVTWGGTRPNPDSLRARDYTPTREERIPHSGGADQFLSFMKNELFPFIETNYKADPANRTLLGCSLGGLVTLYTLFTQPELFTGYVAASPAVGWDRETLYKFEKEFHLKKLSSPVRLYMTIGDVERSRTAYEKFAAQVTSRNNPLVTIESKILGNTGHSGTKSETYSRGLQYIFERPRLQLAATLLDKYTGRYESPTGNKIEIKNENGNLVLCFSSQNKYILFAEAETDFYSTAEFFRVYFKPDGETVEGFRLERYGGTQFMKKIN